LAVGSDIIPRHWPPGLAGGRRRRRTFMTVMGLPVSSFIVLIVVPALVVAYQFYYCWQVYTGRRE